MTDKEKIREEVEKLKLCTMDEHMKFYSEAAEGEYNALCNIEHFIDSLQEESKPKFKVGQIITDPTDSTFTFHINKIEDGRYIEKEDEWVLVKEADANYELVEEPVSEDEDLEEAAKNHAVERYRATRDMVLAEKCKWSFQTGAQWRKENLWKPADGDKLPEIDREVVAFQEIFPTDVDVPSLLKVVIAHRPNPNGWDGKSLSTGKVEHYTPQCYDKGGWNIPDVKFWLDVELPKEIEL